MSERVCEEMSMKERSNTAIKRKTKFETRTTETLGNIQQKKDRRAGALEGGGPGSADYSYT